MDGVQVLGGEGGAPLAVGKREVVHDVEGPVAEQASGLVLEEIGTRCSYYKTTFWTIESKFRSFYTPEMLKLNAAAASEMCIRLILMTSFTLVSLVRI